MKALITSIFSAALAFSTLTASADTNDRAYQMEHKFEKAQNYYMNFKEGASAEEFEKLRPYLKPFTDMEVMADMFTDPRKMVKWMDAISEPEAVYLMMKCSQEPVMWDTWLHGLTDFGKMGRALVRFLEPQTYINWVVAWFDPDLYINAASMADPRKMINWAEQSVNLNMYEPMVSWMNPNWYGPRADWLLDSATYQPVLNIFGIPETL